MQRSTLILARETPNSEALLRIRDRSESEAEIVSVVWEFWKLTQSQHRYRGEPNVIDLGDLDAARKES